MKGKIAAFYGAKVVDSAGNEIATLPNKTEVEIVGEPVILLGKGEHLKIKEPAGYVSVAQVEV